MVLTVTPLRKVISRFTNGGVELLTCLLDVPYCTIRSFPSSINHTIEWAREKFQEMFVTQPRELCKFVEDKEQFLLVLFFFLYWMLMTTGRGSKDQQDLSSTQWSTLSRCVRSPLRPSSSAWGMPEENLRGSTNSTFCSCCTRSHWIRKTKTEVRRVVISRNHFFFSVVLDFTQETTHHSRIWPSKSNSRWLYLAHFCLDGQHLQGSVFHDYSILNYY